MSDLNATSLLVNSPSYLPRVARLSWITHLSCLHLSFKFIVDVAELSHAVIGLTQLISDQSRQLLFTEVFVDSAYPIVYR